MIAILSVSILIIFDRKDEVAFYFHGEDISITLDKWSSFSYIFIISVQIIFFSSLVEKFGIGKFED